MNTYAKEGQKQKRGKTKSKKRMLFGTRTHRPCHYCGIKLTAETATVDHVIALSKGGYDRIGNCVLACRDCNVKKGAN